MAENFGNPWLQMNTPSQRYITLRKAAEASGRSYQRLRDSILKGDLRAIQFSRGGAYYIAPKDLQLFFDTHTVNPLSVKAGVS